jgi:TetR/AcrR family transcriptional regulator
MTSQKSGILNPVSPKSCFMPNHMQGRTQHLNFVQLVRKRIQQARAARKSGSCPPMARAAASKTSTRIQRRKNEQILVAALDVFSTYGFRGSTIDQIAEKAGLSKPNLLYYFDGKQAIHACLLERLLDTWLEPLEKLDPDGDPVEEIWGYAKRKLQMARDYPRESRLFANEMLQGAPRLKAQITGPLKTLVDRKAKVITGWIQDGKIADVDPYHLIFSIWATTQHYADFDVQIRSVMGGTAKTRFAGAEAYLQHLFKTALRP